MKREGEVEPEGEEPWGERATETEKDSKKGPRGEGLRAPGLNRHVALRGDASHSCLFGGRETARLWGRGRPRRRCEGEIGWERPRFLGVKGPRRRLKSRRI